VSAEFTAEVHATVNERSEGWCEVCGVERVYDVHHRHPRKSGGTKRYWIGLASNALGVCRMDHNLIEARRKLAMMFGWLVPEGHDPESQPVLYRGEWKRLGSDGSVEAA
jgi:hypothetical protein